MRINLKNSLRFFVPILITNILIFGVFYYWFSEDISVLKNNLLLYGLIIIIITFQLPQFIVLINHYINNKNVFLRYDKEFIYLNYHGKEIEISEKNIVNWKIIGTAGKSKNSSIKFSLLDDLFYVKVVIENNQTLILSSLVYFKIDKLFEDLFNSFKMENEIHSFPLIKK